MSNTPQEQPQLPDDWERSTGHELASLGHHLRRRRTRRQFLKIGGAFGAALLGTVGLLQLRRPEPEMMENNYAGLACREVAARLSDYLKARLSSDEMTRMQEHLAHCERCRQLVASMQQRS